MITTGATRRPQVTLQEGIAVRIATNGSPATAHGRGIRSNVPARVLGRPTALLPRVPVLVYELPPVFVRPRPRHITSPVALRTPSSVADSHPQICTRLRPPAHSKSTSTLRCSPSEQQSDHHWYRQRSDTQRTGTDDTD